MQGQASIAWPSTRLEAGRTPTPRRALHAHIPSGPFARLRAQRQGLRHWQGLMRAILSTILVWLEIASEIESQGR